MGHRNGEALPTKGQVNGGVPRRLATTNLGPGNKFARAGEN